MKNTHAGVFEKLKVGEKFMWQRRLWMKASRVVAICLTDASLHLKGELCGRVSPVTVAIRIKKWKRP